MQASRRNAALFVLAGLLVSCPPLLAQAPPESRDASHPDSIDLRVDGQPLLVLLERIARQCQLGLVVETGLDGIVGASTTIYAKDAPWDDAMRLLREQYEIEVTPGEKRLVITGADSAFAKRLRRGYYPVETMIASTPSIPVWYRSVALQCSRSERMSTA